MLKRLIMTTVAGIFMAATVFGIPAKRVTLNVTQPDGSSLTITFTGDEFLHYYITSDGMPVIKDDASGAYCYAKVSDGRMIANAITAHNPAERSQTESDWIATNRTAIYTQVAQLYKDNRSRRCLTPAARTKPFVNNVKVGEMPKSDFLKGHRKGLIILAEFSDVKMSVPEPQKTYNDWANQIGYTGNRNAGSLRDYFRSQSFNQFDFEFDVVGPYTLPHIEKYYGAPGILGNDSDVPEMIADLCRMADKDVDFRDYDWDNNGEVEQVFVIYAGYSQAEHAPDWTIWPHAFQLNGWFDQPVILDGVTINRYACSNELKGTSGTMMGGIGTAAHEFSHCLGLPDFYVTDYGSSQFCMGSFSLMDYGNYNNSGYQPMPYTAYERWFCGWMEPIEFTGPTAITNMKSLEDGGEAYVVYNPAQRSEYYLIQNMQNSQFAGPSTLDGLLICHVDYNYDAWVTNEPNNEDGHPRMTYFSATEKSYNNLNAQLFSQNTMTDFTDDTKPAATLYNANSDGQKLMHRPITQISTANRMANFLFCKTIAPIEKLEPRAQTANSYKAMWNYHPEATSYNLRYGSVREISPASRLMFTETMNGLKSDNPGSSNLATKLNNYLDTKGWKGNLIYQSKTGAKIGSSRSNGNLTSPVQNKPSEEQLTIVAKMAPNAASTSMRVKITILSESDKTLASAYVNVPKDAVYAISFSGITSNFKVDFAPDAAAIISDVRVYNGVFSLEDIENGTTAIEYFDTKTVYGITDTWYAINGLTSPQQYFEVQAVSGPFHSEWSSTKTFTLDPTGIATALGETPNDIVDIYTTSGIFMGRTQASKATEGLPAGIYLLRHADGKTRKILIK